MSANNHEYAYISAAGPSPYQTLLASTEFPDHFGVAGIETLIAASNRADRNPGGMSFRRA
jgi:hypothetical protein